MAVTASGTSTSGTLSAPGIGSGLDVKSIVSQLMAVESQPLTALATKEASYQAKLSAYGSLKGTLASFQSAAQALASPARFVAQKATVADRQRAEQSGRRPRCDQCRERRRDGRRCQ
ncbi:MAG: hypothetical protein NT123_17380 [Proteobacteria bacterium]|nr:hypothetical protein [Pseudomonadota bacterium]